MSQTAKWLHSGKNPGGFCAARALGGAQVRFAGGAGRGAALLGAARGAGSRFWAARGAGPRFVKAARGAGPRFVKAAQGRANKLQRQSPPRPHGTAQ